MPPTDPTRTTDPNRVTGSIADPNSTLTRDSTHPAAPLPTTTASRYLLGEEIARGGMGAVYRATDVVFEREVAVKVLLDKYSLNSGTARRFHDEARITGQLQHPGIPPAHDLGTLPDGRPFLAMKLIKGQTLDELLRDRVYPAQERGPLIAVFEQACQAVAYAHAHGVIHRDLKPANVMVGNFGEVQVMDWGLAKVLANRDEDAVDDPEATAAATAVRSLRDSEEHLTQAGSVLGTPAYMPPEQAIGAVDQIDARSDVFGLGGILAAILTEQPPFVGETAESTRQMAAKGKLQDCFKRLEGCGADPELVVLCKSCLASEKTDRPADAGAVARTVATLRVAAEERARRAELDKVKAEGEVAAIEARSLERRKRRQLFVRLGGATVAVLVLGIIGTSVGLARANRAAIAEEKAKNEAVEQKNKAEGRLMALREAINTFSNVLPSLGEGLPLSAALRRELLDFSTELIETIHDENDLNDTYDFGSFMIKFRQANEDKLRGDVIGARKKLEQARVGFQRILNSNPAMLDRARNNLAAACTALGQIDVIERKYPEAEANFQQALALRQAIIADPRGDATVAGIEEGIASTCSQYAYLESTRNHVAEAENWWRQANDLYEKILRIPLNPRDHDRVRLSWAAAQINVATIAHGQKDYPRVIQIYQGIVRGLEDDLKVRPSTSVQLALAKHANYLGMMLAGQTHDFPRAQRMIELAAHHARAIWNANEAHQLALDLGSSYYQLAVVAGRNKQPELARKYFTYCRPFWEICHDNLEEKGVPRDNNEMIDQTILRMLAQGRCGMVPETSRAASELLEYAKQPKYPKKKQRDYAAQAAIGWGTCAVAFPTGSRERAEFFQKAMVAMRYSVSLGYADWHYVEVDDDFDPLREWPEFQQALKEWKGAGTGK